MDFVRLSALENRNYGGDFSDPKWSDSLIATIFNKFSHVPLISFQTFKLESLISNLKIVQCHGLFSSYASLPSLPFRHSFWFSCKIVGTADFQTLKRPLCCRWIPNTAKSSRNAKGKAWFSCKIVGTAYFQTRKWPLCYRLIPDTTTLPGPSGPATFNQKCYFSRLILHLHGTQSCILNRKRTESNLEKQRSTSIWPVIMTPSRSSRGY